MTRLTFCYPWNCQQMSVCITISQWYKCFFIIANLTVLFETEKEKLSLNLNELSHSLSLVWEFYLKIRGPRRPELVWLTSQPLASLTHLLTRILDRCRPWPLCLKVFLMSSAEKPWLRIMCVLSLSWNRELTLHGLH